MIEIDRAVVKEELCTVLQRKYVALVGQRGTEIETIIHTLPHETPPLFGMKFVSIALPRGIDNGDEFEELFLEYLTDTAPRIPSETRLAEDIAQALQNRAEYSANFRIRTVLNILGKGTTASYLVFVLHALAEVSEEPLKNLLTMLREYNDQRSIPGAAGEKLRFLMAGDARLWNLCCNTAPERSPFNIAQRIFLDGLSLEELLKMGICKSLEAAVRLRDLTDGVPSLVEEALTRGEEYDDFLPFFRHIQDQWNGLHPETQEVLKKLAEGTVNFPLCDPDPECLQVPEVKLPWMEAFWAGFLRMRYRQLAWRSPVHQAFVMKHANAHDSSSRSTLVEGDLRERTARLQKALKSTHYSRNKNEPLEEAQSLACHTSCTELATVLELARLGETNETILKKLEQLVANSEENWLRELGKGARANRETMQHFLIEAVIARAHYFLSQSVDIRLPHQERFREQSLSREGPDMVTSPQNPSNPVQSSEADVLLVTVAEIEAKAVLDLFPKSELRHIGDQSYHDLGMIGKARVFMVQSEMGPGGQSGAILTIQEGIGALQPSAVVMVGIAFGVNENKQHIGDILVSKQLLDYELQRIGTSNDSKLVIIPRGDRPSASPRMLSRFRAAANYWQVSPRVRFGLVLSGAKLVDNQDFRDQLLKFEPEAIGGEMEGGGLYAAAQRKKVDWILVKAICDWADGNKGQNESHQQKEAAENAARFTVYVIEKGGFGDSKLYDTQAKDTHGVEAPSVQSRVEEKLHSNQVLSGASSSAQTSNHGTEPDIPPDLIDQFARRNGILFIGAGLSVGAGLSGWAKLVRPLAQSVGYNLPAEDKFITADHLLAATQHYENQRGRNSLVQYLRDHLDTTTIRNTPVHQLIVSLPIQVIFTTNYDDLIERAFREAGRLLNTVVSEIELPFWSADRVQLVKLCGDLYRPESIILTKQDFNTFFATHPRLAERLRTTLETHTPLFLGYSLQDPFFNQIWDNIGLDFGRYRQRGYAVMFNVGALEIDDLRQRGIHVVNLETQGRNRSSVLADWLRGLS